MKKFLEIGKVVGTHGVRGEMRVEPWCDTPDFMTRFKTLYLQEGATSWKIQQARVHKSQVLLKVEGIDSPQQVDLMRGTVLYMNRADVKLPEGRYFIQDLIGLSVVDTDNGKVYGTLSDVLRTGANDVYEMKGEDGHVYLIPAIPDVIRNIDLEAGVVKIYPMKGLFEDED